MTNWVLKSFPSAKSVIGVLHAPPLPGAPRAALGLEDVWETIAREARIYIDAGIDGLLLENHGDAPFHKDRVPPHVAAILAVFLERLRRMTAVPLGVNVLRNDSAAGLAAAFAAGADFIRVNVLTGVTATDQGLIEGCADSLMRYRRELGAPVAVLADVHVKFGTPLYQADIAAAARATLERGLADAVIVTGTATGKAAAPVDLEAVRRELPEAGIICGSGVSTENLAETFRHTDAVIVGSAFKQFGSVEAAVDPDRVGAFMALARTLR